MTKTNLTLEPLIQAQELLSIDQFVHGFSTRTARNMAFKVGDRDQTLKNRLEFFQRLDVDPTRVCFMDPQDSNEISVISDGDLGSTLKVDGLISTTENSFLFLATADCLPVVIVEPIKKIAALIHAGWNGTQRRICEKALDQLEQFDCKAADLIVFIGPCIKMQSYWFPIEDCQQVGDTHWQPYLYCFDDNPGRVHIDVLGYNRAQLAQRGVPTQNILISAEDTYGSDLFYSHRHTAREGGEEGRFATVIGFRSSSSS